MFNQVGGAAAEVLLKFCVVFVIALCSFAVGTFAGKKFTEDQHRLSSLESENADREVASVGDLDVKPTNALSDADLKSLTEEFSQDEAKNIEAAVGDKHKEAEALAQQALEKLDEEMKTIEKTKDAAHNNVDTRQPLAAVSATKTLEKNVDHTTLVAQRVAANQAQVISIPKKEVSRLPSSLPVIAASSAAGKFTVQVASYKTEAEAKAFTEDLVKKGLEAYYIKAELKGQTWFRVSIGSYTGQEEANSQLQKIYKEAKLKGFVTKIAQ